MALCSIAFAAGIVGVVALVKRALFRRRFMMMGGAPFAMASCGPGFGFRGGPPPWGRGRHGFGPGRSFWLRALFAKLDTTPGQEKEIRSAIEDFQREARDAKGDLVSSREGVARAMASDPLDEIALGEASTKLDAATSRVKNAFEGALRRIHATLDGKQRERLAAFLERGPRSFGGGGPYRTSGVEL